MNGFVRMRKRAQMSQESVALAINVERSTIAKWETGVANPRVSTLVALSNLYHCEISDLLADDKPINDREEAV